MYFRSTFTTSWHWSLQLWNWKNPQFQFKLAEKKTQETHAFHYFHSLELLHPEVVDKRRIKSIIWLITVMRTSSQVQLQQMKFFRISWPHKDEKRCSISLQNIKKPNLRQKMVFFLTIYPSTFRDSLNHGFASPIEWYLYSFCRNFISGTCKLWFEAGKSISNNYNSQQYLFNIFKDMHFSHFTVFSLRNLKLGKG